MYITRLYVVAEHGSGEEIWADDIAHINLLKCPLNVNWHQANGFMFGLDGDTIIKDRYDKPLVSADVTEVITALNEIIGDSGNWRAEVAKKLLQDLYLQALTDYSLKNLKVYALFD